MPTRRYVLIIVGIIALILAGRWLLPGAATLYLKHGIERAETEAEERAALCRANHWVHDGVTPTYMVIAEDHAGHEIKPHLDGRYDQVAVVTLRWMNGVEVRRALLGREVLSCVYGE